MCGIRIVPCFDDGFFDGLGHPLPVVTGSGFGFFSDKLLVKRCAETAFTT
jgi:hypothetical protein